MTLDEILALIGRLYVELEAKTKRVNELEQELRSKQITPEE